MPSSYERQRRQIYGPSTRRTAWGYWIPLAVTVTVATAGLAAWIWNERKDNDEDDYPPSGPPPPGYDNAPFPPSNYRPPPSGFPNAPPPGSVPSGQPPYAGGPESREMEEESIVARMSGALRRTPSPQQIIDGASRRVVAGVVAAGAVVGGALSSIQEEDKKDFEDHSRWSEEADSQNGSRSRKGPDLRDAESQAPTRQIQAGTTASRQRKTVAIVVSAETSYEHDDEASYHQEHASILSHLPEHIDTESRVFVLIYAPDLTQHPLAGSTQPGHVTMSMNSSYSNIGHEDVQSVGGPSPEPDAPLRSKMFEILYSQAQALVDKDTMIMPFTTPTGHIQILRHLGPEIVYMQATLAGVGGDAITHVSSWVGQVVLVVGDESGHGGLVDSEDERGEATIEKWWHDDPRIGLGKGIEVVEGLRVGEDFRRRVAGHD